MNESIETSDFTPSDSPEAEFDIACPRCNEQAAVRFYGPCPTCRAALRAEQGSDQRDIAAAEYEPKMNVTPNAVALKD